MSALRRGETRDELIERAGMDGYGFNTCVVRATDDGPRVHVTGAAITPTWGDCVALGFMPEGGNVWYYSHFSPARARIIAMHLLRLASMKERHADGCIDRKEKFALNQQSTQEKSE